MPRRPGVISPTQVSKREPPRVFRARDYLKSEIAARLRTGHWEMVRPGAYIAALEGHEEFDRRRLRRLAAAAAIVDKSRADVLLSHETAALVHGLPMVGCGRTHLVQPFPGGQRDAADVARHFVEVPEAHRTERHGLPVTTLERTVIDCARTLARPEGLVIADAALHAGADRATCEQMIEALAGRSGVVAARWVLAHADGGAESPGESWTRFLILEAGLPRPSTQVPVETRRGVFWGDLGWRRERVVVEFDGRAKYEAKGSASRAVLAEKQRQEAIEAEGWVVVRASVSDLRSPEPFLSRLRRALAGGPSPAHLPVARAPRADK